MNQIPVTLFQLSQAGKTELDTLRERLERNEELANYAVSLMWEVSQIPYICGKQDCSSPGCIAIRNAHNSVRELLMVSRETVTTGEVKNVLDQ